MFPKSLAFPVAKTEFTELRVSGLKYTKLICSSTQQVWTHSRGISLFYWLFKL